MRNMMIREQRRQNSIRLILMADSAKDEARRRKSSASWAGRSNNSNGRVNKRPTQEKQKRKKPT